MQFTDQTGHSISLNKTPKRIVSLVPSQSELLWDLGLKNELIGITKFCIHPNEMFESVERVGGTKQLNLEKIRSLNPDLIIGNKEENEKSQIEELRKEFTVWMSDVFDLNDALKMITSIAEMTDKSTEGKLIADTIQQRFSRLNNASFKGKSVAYFMWYNPLMVAASHTFIDAMLKTCGLTNAFATSQRYPEITADVLKQINPDFIFLSTEPFPFNDKHVIEMQSLCPDAKVMIVDGELFSWYGSRLLKAPDYFKSLGGF